ncbi:hypothetical protein ElyMa_003778100 [Elysia marginata]|uniref:DUF7869 domain-containing protein n=1 Tax=Elysia marginata TaxID=1093978 RepID=A0AAV4FAS1_9GAST|nr:hypothetical protein ElyMa_003778100 [Elysia marginata]
MTGLHTDVDLHFMLPGHTKFSPDWCFGLLKKKFRRTEVSCLDEMVKVVEDSTHNGINRAQLVGTEDGRLFVPTYDWQKFFAAHGKPFKGIKSFQHFKFSSSEPGICYARQTTSDLDRSLVLEASARELSSPPFVPPPGLSRERQKYLFNNIRQFVKPEFQDVVCPCFE